MPTNGLARSADEDVDFSLSIGELGDCMGELDGDPINSASFFRILCTVAEASPEMAEGAATEAKGSLIGPINKILSRDQMSFPATTAADCRVGSCVGEKICES